MSSDDAFDRAEFYDCLDSEVLSHATPEDAVAAWLEFWIEQGCDIRKIAEEHECEITAHARETVSEDWIRERAETMLDDLAEDFEHDFGDPSGDRLHDEEIKACVPAMIDAVRQFTERADVWRCERVAARVLDEDEVEAATRQHSPESFEKSDSPSDVSTDTAKDADQPQTPSQSTR
jgi:hypothetical protein